MLQREYRKRPVKEDSNYGRERKGKRERCRYNVFKIDVRCNVSLPPLFQLTREGTAPGIHSNHCRSNTPKSSTNQDVKTERNGFRIKWGTGSILRILPPKGAQPSRITQDNPRSRDIHTGRVILRRRSPDA